MGRIVDLLAEVVAGAEEGPDGKLVLDPDGWERLRGEWQDEDIEDMLELARNSLYQTDLVEAADSLSARLLEWLGELGGEAAFRHASERGATVAIETVAQIARRVERLEEALEALRDEPGPERAGFDDLQERLINRGIERMMRPADLPDIPGE